MNSFHALIALISLVNQIQSLTIQRSHFNRNIKLYNQNENTIKTSPSQVSSLTLEDHDTDYVVIGSGIGGLSAAALLRYYGYSVTVLEAHYLPGGVAHTFDVNGFKFDAGPSLWNGNV